MDVLTDTEMSDRYRDAHQSPHDIWVPDGGMWDILMHGDIQTDGGCTDTWGMYRCPQSDRHTKMPDNHLHACQLNELK